VTICSFTLDHLSDVSFASGEICAAVDGNDAAGGEAAVVAGEESDRAGDLVGWARRFIRLSAAIAARSPAPRR